MKFLLKQSRHLYTDESPQELQLVEALKSLGFQFDDDFYVTNNGEPEIDIEDLGTLLQMVKQHGKIIMQQDQWNDYRWTLEIYNGGRE